MPSAVRNQRVWDLARVQHGVVARPQLLELGLTSDSIEGWLENGRLFTIFRGVYALGRPAIGLRSMWMAGVLRGGPTAVLAGLSSAAAWGLANPRRTIEVCRPAGRTVHANSRHPHESVNLVVKQSPLIDFDTTMKGAIPTMTPARTLIDVARSPDERELRRVFLNAGRSGLLTRACLEACRSRGSSFKGHQRLMKLVDQWTPDTGPIRSPLESEFLLLCGKYGIPPPRTNFRLGGYEADCFWPGTKIVAELDSRTFHDDGFGFEDDRAKGNALSLRGFTVLRFTRLMVTERPAEVARTLRLHLAGSGLEEPA